MGWGPDMSDLDLCNLDREEGPDISRLGARHVLLESLESS
jgi:hypothetical protein